MLLVLLLPGLGRWLNRARVGRAAGLVLGGVAAVWAAVASAAIVAPALPTTPWSIPAGELLEHVMVLLVFGVALSSLARHSAVSGLVAVTFAFAAATALSSWTAPKIAVMASRESTLLPVIVLVSTLASFLVAWLLYPCCAASSQLATAAHRGTYGLVVRHPHARNIFAITLLVAVMHEGLTRLEFLRIESTESAFAYLVTKHSVAHVSTLFVLPLALLAFRRRGGLAIPIGSGVVAMGFAAALVGVGLVSPWISGLAEGMRHLSQLGLLLAWLLLAPLDRLRGYATPWIVAPTLGALSVAALELGPPLLTHAMLYLSAAAALALAWRTDAAAFRSGEMAAQEHVAAEGSR